VSKVLGAVVLLIGGFRIGLPQTSGALDHAFKLIEIYAVGSGASDLVVAFWALMGFHHTDAFDHLFRSRSVLEFWSRYDRWVFVWLKRQVFDRVGRRRPVLACSLARWCPESPAISWGSSSCRVLPRLPVSPSRAGCVAVAWAARSSREC
jgi:hypothetical protein